jgi:hypothetical protein
MAAVCTRCLRPYRGPAQHMACTPAAGPSNLYRVVLYARRGAYIRARAETRKGIL